MRAQATGEVQAGALEQAGAQQQAAGLAATQAQAAALAETAAQERAAVPPSRNWSRQPQRPPNPRPPSRGSPCRRRPLRWGKRWCKQPLRGKKPG